MVVIVTTNYVVGPSIGHVTSLNCSHVDLAPSISAAWYNSLGILVKPAKYKTILKPKACQIPIKHTVQIAVFFCFNQYGKSMLFAHATAYQLSCESTHVNQ